MDFLYFLLPYRTPALEVLFQGITYLGQEVFVIAFICWLYWCANKQLAYTLGFTYFTSGLLAQGLKITFRIPRPWVIDPDFPVVASAKPAATGYSFPSGHTQSGTALFSTLAFHTKKGSIRFLCILTFLAIGFSRMYLGCHTPKDVLTAMAITLIPSWLFYRFFYPARLTKMQNQKTALLLTVISFALAFYAFSLYRGNIIEAHYAQDCCKAAGAGLGFAIGYYVERIYISFSIPKTKAGKLLRLILGLAVTLLLQEGLKPILGTSLPASFLRYFLVILWVLVLYPILFTRIAPAAPKDKKVR